MLAHLSIKNYALIDSIEISFSKGFNVITGETGSGKSIIIGALGLVLGERADSTSAKDKSKKCVIEASFDLSSFNLKPFFTENDLDYEALTIVRREINQQGKSRAFINDTPIGLAVLKQFTSFVIDVHSQHKTIDLNKKSFQLNLVDALAGTSKLLSDYEKLYNQLIKLKRELQILEESAEKAKSDENYLEFVLSEFEGLDLESINQEELEAEQTILEHSEEIKTILNSSLNQLDYPENGIIPNLAGVSIEINKISDYNSAFSELNQRLESSLIELRDVQSEIEQLESKTEYNPERLNEINELLNTCYQLQKKHAVNSIGELSLFKADIEEKLNKASNSDKIILAKKQEIGQREREVILVAKELSSKRKESFSAIENQVNELLVKVAMPSAKLKLSSEKTEMNSTGIDDLNFLIKTNKGSDFQLISEIASGGEMSRIMLVFKTILSRFNNLPTIIFDEIDTGISGEVADKVGEVMKELSINLQVFSITHLPQVTSKGEHHFYVYKSESEQNTNTHIKLLSLEERIVEIAKMMSGEEPTNSSLNTAKELLS